MEVSSDHGRTCRQVLVQEYTFKSGSGVATLAALRLFASADQR